MKRISIILLALVAIALAAYWGCKKDSTEEPTLNQSKLEEKTMRSEALVGNNFNDPFSRKMMVYLPPGYDAERAEGYPVVYLLPNYPLSHWAYVDPFKGNEVRSEFPLTPPEGFQGWLDNLIAKKEIQPTIVVTPDVKTRYKYSFYTNSALQGNYEDYIAKDLVKFVDENYNTIATRQGRSIVGQGEGGYGAIRMGMLYADVFGTVVVHSAMLDFNGMKDFFNEVIAENSEEMTGPRADNSKTTMVYGMAAAWSPNLKNPPYHVDLPFDYPSGKIRPRVWNYWLQSDPMTMLDQYGSNLKTLNGLYIDASDSDMWLPYSVNFHDALNTRGIKHTFEIYQGTAIDKTYPRLGRALNFCTATMYKE